MTTKPQSLIIRSLAILISGWLLYACNSQETPSPSIPPITSTASIASIEAQPSATPESTDTPDTPPQSTVLLVLPSETDPGQYDELTSMLSELAANEGLDFEIRSSLKVEDLSLSHRIVVAVPPDPGLTELAQAAPRTQFIGIGFPDLELSPNLSVIDTQGTTPGDIGFLAGYLAAVVTPEWRVGAITVSDTANGVLHRDGFLNGAVFFCGLCRQTYPPFNTYPMYVEAPAGSTPQEWQSAAGILIDQAVHTAYIPPVVGDDRLLEYLAGAEVFLIGATPPPPGLEDHWIATISVDIDTALRTAWPDLIAGQGGLNIPIRITLTDVNPDLLSPGRQRLVENLISELEAEFIDTGVGDSQDTP